MPSQRFADDRCLVRKPRELNFPSAGLSPKIEPAYGCRLGGLAENNMTI